jgi:hypothetical protein
MVQPSSKSCIIQVAQIVEEPSDFLLGLNLTRVKVKEEVSGCRVCPQVDFDYITQPCHH